MKDHDTIIKWVGLGLTRHEPDTLTRIDTPSYYADSGAFMNLTFINGNPMQVWVEYDGVKKQLNVTLAPIDVGKPKFPLLSL